MTDQQMTAQQHAMAVELDRVRAMLAEAVDDIETHGGDIHYFSAAFLRAAIELQVEVEGPESTEQAVTAIALRELDRTKAIHTC